MLVYMDCYGGVTIVSGLGVAVLIFLSMDARKGKVLGLKLVGLEDGSLGS